eukprot:CFRG0421T1
MKVQPSFLGKGFKVALLVVLFMLLKIFIQSNSTFFYSTVSIDEATEQHHTQIEKSYDLIDDPPRRAPHFREGMDRLYGTNTKRALMTDSASSCDTDGKLVCVFRNVCVDHSNKNRITVLNRVPYQTRAHNLFWDLGDKGHPELDIFVRHVPGDTEVTYISGTTHFFHERYRNRLHLTMNVFAMRHFIAEVSPNRDYNLMIMDDLPFKYDPVTEPVLQMYRSITPNRKVYFRDNAIGHQNTQLTCFDRAVFGSDREVIVPVIKPAMMHLQEFIDHKAKMIADSHATKWRARAMRIQEHAVMLKTTIPEFKTFLVNAMGLQGCEWNPKEALLVFRGPIVRATQVYPAYRSIVNEREVIEMVERYGFKVNRVDFAKMTHMEQILSSRRAGLFIGMHGAGMANSFWTNENAVVLELHTYGFQKWGYETLSYYAGTKYLSWVNMNPDNAVPTWHSQSEKYNNDPDGRNQWRSRDQIIPISELEPLVQQAREHLEF